jgi:peptidoglycan-associated lipoprotein
MGLRYIASGRNRSGVILMALMLSIFAAGCKKKVVTAPTPPPPPPPTKIEQPKPAAPVIASFEAEPATIERGQSATLRWRVTGETSNVTIAPGIGTVAADGSRQVFPGSTLTYTLTASGPGGSATSTASVNVTTPAAPPPRITPPVKRTLSEVLSQDVKDVFFDYDSSTIREDGRAALARNSDVLKGLFNDYPTATVVIEGHADERGSAEYNLGLADRRATASKEFLVQLGVPANRLTTVSFGKERPQCTEANESCWQQNRRAHFSAGQ